MNGLLSGGVGDEFPHIKSKFLFDAPPCRRGASLVKQILEKNEVFYKAAEINLTRKERCD